MSNKDNGNNGFFKRHQDTVGRLCNRPTIHLHTDLEDLRLCLEEDGQDTSILEEKSNALALMSFFEREGRVTIANIYDDWQQNNNRYPWKQTGFNPVHVVPDGENGDESRVGMVTILTAISDAALYKPDCVVLVYGGANYIEFIKQLRKFGTFVYLVGVESQTPAFMKLAADYWMPINNIFGETRNENPIDVDTYNFSDFIQLVKELEESKMAFVGLKHLIRTVLPKNGVNSSDAHKIVEEAENRGYIELYHVDGAPNQAYKTKACRLIRNNPDVEKTIVSDEMTD